MGKNEEGIFGAVFKIQALSTLATVLVLPRFLLGRKACNQPSPRVRKSLPLFMKDTSSLSRKTPGQLSNQPVQPGAAPLRPGVQIWTPGTETARTRTFSSQLCPQPQHTPAWFSDLRKPRNCGAGICCNQAAHPPFTPLSPGCRMSTGTGNSWL